MPTNSHLHTSHLHTHLVTHENDQNVIINFINMGNVLTIFNVFH